MRKLLIVAALFAVPGLARAQSVDGRLLSQNGAHPVSDALVILQDTAGTDLGRAMTASSGGFHLQAGAPGVYRIKVLRIGQQPWVTPVTLTAGAAVRQDFPIPDQPVVLAELKVKSDNSCRTDPDARTAAAVLINEADKALQLAQQTLDHSHVRFTMVSRRVQLGTDLGQVQVLEDGSGTLVGWPVKSAPLEVLQQQGFIVDSTAGLDGAPSQGRIYYGPDPAVILSPWFRSSYCFQAVEPRPDQPDLVGVRFKPAEGTHHSAIHGTFWLDRKSLELRVLEFEFTGLGKWVPDNGAGGRLQFMHLPTGGFVTSRWALRAPIANIQSATIQMGTLDLSEKQKLAVAGYVELDGAITDVRTQDDSLIEKLPGIPGLGADAADTSHGSPAPTAGTGGPIRLVQRDTALGVRVIAGQNLGAWPVRVTKLEVSDCMRVAKGCGTQKVDVVIEPGKFADIATLKSAKPGMAWIYRVGYAWEEVH